MREDGADKSGGFVHLHLHSEYSLLDGGNTITKLLDRVKDMGMDAVAVTDHGNLHGAFEFYARATASGIKPILGIEAYVAPEDRTDRSPTGVQDAGFHLVLLAENNAGWQNLVKLSSDAFINGFYYKPRMDRSTLTDWCDGVIAINGHLGSSLAWHLVRFADSGKQEHWDAAREEAIWHRDTFGTNDTGEPRFFIEVQRHDVADQQAINPHLVALARELDIPLVCDNDAHFLGAEDWDTHDTLCCISMQKTKDDQNRIRYSRDLYVKSPQQMADLFTDLPEAVQNTVSIAKRCEVKFDLSQSHAPIVRVTGPDTVEPRGSEDPSEWHKAFCRRFELHPFDSHIETDVTAEQLKSDCDDALRNLCEAGLIWRYSEDGITEDIRNRLERELAILADKNISAYFLIVWDFVNWAHQRGIPANARGSGVGTMVGYVLGLSNACPVQYGLLFERFTDPNRSEYPDIDIDICQNGRSDVIAYVREKYGHVAQIVTFGRLKARAAIKDVARVHGLAPSEGQRLANLVPHELNITIDDALKKDADFRGEYEGNESSRSVIDTARELEHHARHIGIHAAGVVIATEPLEHIVPLCRATGTNEIVTQWDGPTCEQVGLLKMDFLGLRTLSTIEQCCELVRKTLSEDSVWAAVGRAPGNGPHPLDLARLPLDDERVIDLFRRGDTAGVFQFESGGMRRLLQEMRPDRIEDLIAANALFRPGPMDLIPQFCNRKHGKEAVPSTHGIIDRYTEETYGVMVYQEQVMQIVHALGDIPLRDAYTLIKAISKKKHKVINANRPKFIDGAVAKGLSEPEADDLFDLILKFAGYGFNKSHSTGYSIIAWQTAWLKTYFPVQYMAAVLTYESGARKVEDWAPYIEDCRRTRFPDHTADVPHIGVDVGPPDINRSEATFSVVFDEDESRTNTSGHVRFGLSAIKGAGNSAVSAIVEERQANGPFESIFDFCGRLSNRAVNRATIETLIKAGAFDSVHGLDSRASLLIALDRAISLGTAEAEDRRRGQSGLFGGTEEGEAAPPPDLTRVTPWTEGEVLAREREVLGIYVSGHPLDQHDETLRIWCSATTAALADVGEGQEVAVGGMLSSVHITTARSGPSKGRKMAILTVQDKVGTVDCVVFSDAYQQFAELLQPDDVVILVGRVDRSRGDLQVRVDRVVSINNPAQQLAGRLELTFRKNGVEGELRNRMEVASGLLRQAGGARVANGAQAAEVMVHIVTGDKIATLRSQRRVVVEPKLLQQLRDVVGNDNVRVARQN